MTLGSVVSSPSPRGICNDQHFHMLGWVGLGLVRETCSLSVNLSALLNHPGRGQHLKGCFPTLVQKLQSAIRVRTKNQSFKEHS